MINQVTDGWIFFVDDDALNGTQTLAKINKSKRSKIVHFQNEKTNWYYTGKNFGKDVVECDIATLIYWFILVKHAYPNGQIEHEETNISQIGFEMGKSS